MADWKETSKAGFDFEDFCLKDITEKKNPLAYKNMQKENYSYYDIVLHDGNVSPQHVQKTLECKFDEKAHETGNICIEVGCNGRLSGLLITKADYWLISDGYETFLITKARIHDCIMNNMKILQFMKKYPVTQEDGVTKEMDFYLIPKKIFSNWCLEIADINNMTYAEMI